VPGSEAQQEEKAGEGTEMLLAAKEEIYEGTEIRHAQYGEHEQNSMENTI